MIRAFAFIAILLLAGCRSPQRYELPAEKTTTPEEAQARLEAVLLEKQVTCDLTGASLEVTLSQLSEQTGVSFALDPRLCFTHGPQRLVLQNVYLGQGLDELKRQCPGLQIEHWRGVIFL